MVGLLFHGAMHGPRAAFFSELFGTEACYTGVSIGAQLASGVAGAPAPLFADFSYGGTPIRDLGADVSPTGSPGA